MFALSVIPSFHHSIPSKFVFSTPPTSLHGFEWNLVQMLYHKSRSACGEIIHVRQILAELWPLTLRIFTHFSFLVHLSWRLKCTIVITRCPSSVICRPSGVNFSHFRLLLWNHWTEFNETSQNARTQHPLPSLCFSGRSEKQDGRPGLWFAETFLTSPLKLLNGIQRNLIGSKISMSSTKFVFFGPLGKTRRPPWPLIGWDNFDFSSETAEWNSPVRTPGFKSRIRPPYPQRVVKGD